MDSGALIGALAVAFIVLVVFGSPIGLRMISKPVGRRHKVGRHARKEVACPKGKKRTSYGSKRTRWR